MSMLVYREAMSAVRKTPSRCRSGVRSSSVTNDLVSLTM